MGLDFLPPACGTSYSARSTRSDIAGAMGAMLRIIQLIYRSAVSPKKR